MEPRIEKRVAIVQSNYVPWKGYFDLMSQADEMILLDDVQYTRRDWRNRNRIKSREGVRWITVPVRVRGRYEQRIDETEISDPSWAERHWATLRHAYARAPCFSEVAPSIEDLYAGCASPLLTEVNEHLLRGLSTLLHISTPISRSVDVPLVTDPTERLVALCRGAGATEYLTGPSSWAYLRRELFTQANISVTTMTYGEYPRYPQLHGTFEDRVSVLDVLFHTGSNAPLYIDSNSPAATTDKSTQAEPS